jgi:hypothetical protein
MATSETYPDGAAKLDAKELGIDPEELWQAADKLRGSIDAAEYKHVVLGLIFLKYMMIYSAGMTLIVGALVLANYADHRRDKQEQSANR